jgi:soluble lytic murein transglycosylase-like protein
VTLEDFRFTAALRRGVSLSTLSLRILKLSGLYAALTIGGSALWMASNRMPGQTSMVLFVFLAASVVYALLFFSPARVDVRDLLPQAAYTLGVVALAFGAVYFFRQYESYRQIAERDAARSARRQVLQELPYGKAIADRAERHGVDGLLIAAIVEAESAFKPDAVSPRGAVGLMQITPAVGQAYGTGTQALKDPGTNIDVGIRYLRGLIEDYNGDLRLSLAAYDATPAAVDRYGGIPPYRETRSYVQQVLSLYERYSKEAEKTKGGPVILPLSPKSGTR